jgi:hypothetical protein
MGFNKSRLTLDDISAIKQYCFGNLTEFWTRYEEPLAMARTTFYKIMQGNYVSEEYIDRIARVMAALAIHRESGLKGKLVAELVTRIKKFDKSGMQEDWASIKQMINKYEVILIEQ